MAGHVFQVRPATCFPPFSFQHLAFHSSATLSSIGTIPTVISVPCGVNAGSEKLDFCAVARKGIPNLDEITRLAAGYCKCLPGAFDFIDLDTAKSAITSLDTGEATYSILSKFSSMEQVRSVSAWHSEAFD